MNETPIMLYSKHLTINDMNTLYNPSQSIEIYDHSNQNIVTHLIKNSRIELFVESR